MTISDDGQEAAFVAFAERLSNWGRWGPDDELGTLNLITPDTIRRAAAEVRLGRSVSCARTVKFNQPSRLAAQRFMVSAGSYATVPGSPDLGHSASEYVGMAFHGLDYTHLDAPAHMIWDQRIYNGFPASGITPERGALRGAVTAAGDGIVTRGVFLDIAASTGGRSLGGDLAVYADDLAAAAERQGVEVHAADAVVARVRGPVSSAVDPQQPGLHYTAMQWLAERDVAVFASDVATEVLPSQPATIAAPAHIIAMVFMGLWLVDNCDLEPLAEACRQHRRSTFQFIVGPLRLRGGTGSPVNPIVVL